MKDRIYVAGATGFQGGNIAALLLSQGHEVVTLKPANEEERPVVPNLEIQVGDFSEPQALSKVLKGVQKAVFTFPLIFDLDKAREYTQNFAQAAEEQGLSLVVFNSGFDLSTGQSDLIAIQIKREVQDILQASKLNVTTLVPDIYIDNLAAPWSIPVILENGILPYPVAPNEPVPWISHSDLAKFAVSALDKPELAGQSLPIGGNLFTGEEIAEAISHKIGSPVNFASLTPDQFESQLAPAFGPTMAQEISNLYRYVAQNKAALVSKDFAKSQELLNVKPQALSSWVESIAWRA